jgi:putative transposase
MAHRRHLERVLRIFVEHYNGHRPHRALDLGAPTPARAVPRLAIHAAPEIRRRDRLGGLIQVQHRGLTCHREPLGD